MVKLSGGEALAKSLAREGVEVVFGIAGIQIYGIVAGLRDEPGIRMITTRHEQAATYMADGYARASGKPGVAVVVLARVSTTLPAAWPMPTPALRPYSLLPARSRVGRSERTSGRSTKSPTSRARCAP